MIGIVLAGGSASRMGGGDKGLLPVGGLPILERVLATVRAQCDRIAINANGDPARFSAFGHPIIVDTLPNRPGPLAGVLAGLDHVAEHHPGAEFILTVPGDAPFLPLDLVARLEERRAADRAWIARARSGDHDHGVVALWPVALRGALRLALVDEGLRRVGAFAQRYAVATVTWPMDPFDPFLNVNTPEDLAAAERVARATVTDR